MSLLRVGQRVTAVLSGWLIVVIVATSAHAQMDVVVLNTGIIAKNGTVGEVTAYSLASTSCNVGSQVAVWVDDTNEHPVIAGNLYRIDNGLLEQIGMSWLKHAFCAVNEPGCGDCQGTPCDTLGVQCADTYGAGLNGAQQGLGPRSDVNATTGEFQYPFPTQGQTGDPIYKRCQVRTTDLDPALHPDAEYFGVVQYVTTDEQAFGTQFNNVSYRRATVGAFDGSGFPLTYIGDTVTQADPIDAWDAIAGDVERVEILTTEANLEGIPGRWVIGTRVENPAPNLYRYQYAIYNDNSDRSLQGLTLPLPPGITLQSIHFHDVDYHSGEPYDNSDWQVEVGADFIRWSGETFANNANANALRWGTTYSFSFETNAPPTAAMATLDYFKPGSIPSESFTTRVPSANFTLGVTQLDCSATGGAVQLDWSNADSYDSLQISRDGTPLALLPGNSTSFTDPSPEVGLHTYSVTADIGGLLSAAVSCQLEVPIPIAFTFPNGLPTFWNDTGGEIAVNIAAVGDSSVITFEVVEEPVADFIPSTSAICTDSCITFDYAGTNIPPTQSFFWDFGSGAIPSTSTLATPPCVEYATGGSKTVSLTVSYKGCTVSTTQSVQVSAAPLAVAGVDQEFCEGTGGVQLDGSVSGGTAPYFYTWWCDNPPNCGIGNVAVEDPLVNPNVNLPTEIREYYFQITDVNGCKSAIDTVLVTVKARPRMDAGLDTALCPPSAPGAFLQGSVAADNNAPGPISYFWTPSAGLNNPNDNPNPYARPDTTTIYTLIGVSANGCSSLVNTLDPQSDR